ncbi:MAG: iron-siderophore ABC transporter substrate-binding protein [Propionibacteriaceae bacterium]
MRRPLRQALGLLAAFATVLALGGCNASAQEDEAGDASASPVADANAFPVTIAHKFGQTTIEKAATRIVTVGLKEQDDLLALGIVPVGATKWLELGKGGIIGTWAEQALGDAPVPQVLSIDDGVEFEKVAALKPDLIIGLYSGLTQDEYDKLSLLAPVVAQPKEYPDWGIPWDEQALKVGQAVGQATRMQQLVDATKQTVADAKTAHPEFSGKVGLVATNYEGIYVYASPDPRSRLLTELGFSLPADIDQVIGTKDFGANLSNEKMEWLDRDVVLWFAGSAADQKKTESGKVYQQLGISKEKRTLFIKPGDKIENAFSFITVLSLPFLTESLTPMLTRAVDGDPGTAIQD